MKSVKKKRETKISKQDNKMGTLENVTANVMCQLVRATGKILWCVPL